MTDWCTVRHSLLLRHHLLPFLDLPASLIAMAMAWRRDFTLGPVFEPECSLPRLNSPITRCSLVLLAIGFLLLLQTFYLVSQLFDQPAVGSYSHLRAEQTQLLDITNDHAVQITELMT